MSNAVLAHGSLIAVEANPIVAGTFIDIAELTVDIDFGFTRPVAEVTPHNDTIDAQLPGIMKREPIALAGNFIFDAAGHDHLTGLQKHWIENEKFGTLFKGPAWTTGVDEIIASGYVTTFKRLAPEGEGPYGFEATLVLTGPMLIDTVVVGVAG